MIGYDFDMKCMGYLMHIHLSFVLKIIELSFTLFIFIWDIFVFEIVTIDIFF